MKTIRPCFARASLFAVLTTLAFIATTSLSANERPTLQPLADQKMSALPVSTSFDKGTPGENGGPYALKVKNTSNASLKVNATIRWSTVSHANAKTIDLPAHTLAPNEVWTINDLSVEDKITLSADGHEKLEVKVPPAKTAK